ncbi:unnamed protein product [Brassica oleracea var. botrytis]
MVMDGITMDVVNGWVMMEVVMEEVRIKMVVIMSQRRTSASDKRNRNSNCSFQWCGAQPPEPLNNHRRRWEIEHHRDSKAELIPSVDHSVEMETLRRVVPRNQRDETIFCRPTHHSSVRYTVEQKPRWRRLSTGSRAAAVKRTFPVPHEQGHNSKHVDWEWNREVKGKRKNEDRIREEPPAPDRRKASRFVGRGLEIERFHGEFFWIRLDR